MKTLVYLFIAAVAGIQAQTPPRQAADVLRDLRAALGGEAALDAVQALSMTGSMTKSRGKSLSLEVVAVLPDRFMTVERDLDRTGPLEIDVTYYNGFKGAELIRWTEANIPFPPEPGPQTPAAIAQRRAENLLRQKQIFARLCLVLFGKSIAGYPLQFTAVASSTIEGRAVDIIDANAADGFVVKLYVDSATHLPTRLTWEAPAPVLVTTSMSSQVMVRGGQVASQTPAQSASVPALPPPGAVVTWQLVASDFKIQNGLNWPRRLRVMADREVHEDMRLGSFRINPKLDPRKFDVGR